MMFLFLSGAQIPQESRTWFNKKAFNACVKAQNIYTPGRILRLTILTLL